MVIVRFSLLSFFLGKTNSVESITFFAAHFKVIEILVILLFHSFLYLILMVFFCDALFDNERTGVTIIN